MKKTLIPLLILLLCLLKTTNAQDITNQEKNKNKETKVEVFRDRLMIDLFHTFWLKSPIAINNKKFNPGFNIALMWDFKHTNKGPISFGLGLGVTYNTQFTDALLKLDTASQVMKYYILPEKNDYFKYKLNRISYVSCNIPLELRYRHANGFKFTLGARLGLIAELSQRYKGDDYAGSNTQLNYKTLEFHNKQKFNFDIYVRCGWKFISVYYSYQVNKMFEIEKGPLISPMSLGLTITLF